jgi:hypothetical protein
MPISTPAEIAQRCGGDKEHFKHVLEHLFLPAIEKSGHAPVLPAGVGADLIHAEVIRKLETEDLVLCDMSTLNPNVFFELGIRSALDKPICLVRDSPTEAPFDVGVVNYHTYDPLLSPWKLDNEIVLLTEHLTKSANGSRGRNTLWQYFGLTKRAAMNPTESPIEQKMDLILTRLDAIGGTNVERVDTSKTDSTETKSVEWVVRRARAIASEVSAKFGEAKVADDSIELDLGIFILGKAHLDRIRDLGKKYGYDIQILQNGAPFTGV